MTPAEPRVPRRRFLKTVGVAGVSSMLVPGAFALAQTPAPGGAPAAPGAPPAPAPAKEEISEDARALAAIIERRYGKNLTPEQVASIAKDFDGDLKAFPRLYTVKVANGDEPDFTFRA